ncbi:MAG: alpha/beta hydrolase family esterase, partial [Rubrimonas sp.]
LARLGRSGRNAARDEREDLALRRLGVVAEELGRPVRLGKLEPQPLVGRLAEEGRVDPEQVFVAGPSIGGMMALRVACEAPDLIAGAAVAIAALPEGLDCPADGPALPMLFLHGDADAIVPPEGGRIGGESILIRDRGRVRSIDETVGRFAVRNGCGEVVETALADRDPTDGSTVLQRVYQDCAAPLIHYVVEGGGHTWPGSRPARLGGALVGATNQDFSATRALERFFLSLIDSSFP